MWVGANGTFSDHVIAHGGYEGQKAVCLDGGFLERAANKDCLVYSFGLGDEWSFEDAMNDLGCFVRAFDPTVDRPANLTEEVNFNAFGLSKANAYSRLVDDRPPVPLKTFSSARKHFGEEEKEIAYVKLDIEGHEILAMPLWNEKAVEGVQMVS